MQIIQITQTLQVAPAKQLLHLMQVMTAKQVMQLFTFHASHAVTMILFLANMGSYVFSLHFGVTNNTFRLLPVFWGFGVGKMAKSKS